jgi:predicted DCC family thiol-disulfide oxidoreductase YuxK
MSTPHPGYPLTLLYDASCPVCRLEMDELRHRNAAGRLVFVDISAPDFDLSHHWPATAEPPTTVDMNAALHGIDADGVVYTGLDTIRLAYAGVGMGWLWAPTAWPVLRPIFDLSYRLFARHRYAISERLAPVVNVVARHRAQAHERSAKARADRMQRCHDAQAHSPGSRCDL